MIYFIQAENGHIKIGYTDHDDANIRLANLQTGSPVLLKLLGTIPGTMEDEKDFHRRFAAHRVHGEWFKPVDDLLVILPQESALSCEGKTVAEKSVTIKVLTVGRKQFTRSLLGQLPETAVIGWDQCVRDWHKRIPGTRDSIMQFVQGVSLEAYLRSDVWGWVQEPGKSERTIIHEQHRQLFRCADQEPFRAWSPSAGRMEPASWVESVGGGYNESAAINCFLSFLWPRRNAIRGMSHSDQLFIGV